LGAGGELVDRELGPQRGAGGAVAAGVDAVAGAVLPVALPGDHEIPAAVHRQRRLGLAERGDLVDEELAAQRGAGAAVAAGVDAVVAAVLVDTVPGDDE